MHYKGIWRTDLFIKNQNFNTVFDSNIIEYIYPSPHKFFQLKFNKIKLKRGLYVRVH
jgi:hypothetical protein